LGIGDWGLGIGPNPQSPIPKLTFKLIMKFKQTKQIKFFFNTKNYWGLGIGDWGLGPIPNPQSPIPKIKYKY